MARSLENGGAGAALLDRSLAYAGAEGWTTAPAFFTLAQCGSVIRCAKSLPDRRARHSLRHTDTQGFLVAVAGPHTLHGT